jgi:hypothetical protein
MPARKPGRATKNPGRLEEAAEHVIDGVRDRVRDVELGLDAGDHTIAGEVAGVIEEVVHPEGEEDERPAARRRR